MKERVLLRGSKPVSLTQKVFATLLMLVENAGHIVEKEDFIRALWPDTYVEEGNVAQNIFKIRRVLGKNRVGKPYRDGSKAGLPLPGDGESIARHKRPNRQPLPQIAHSVSGKGNGQRKQKGSESIAVLPLANASRDETVEYLSDGITESIISSLSGLPQLRVMARSSVLSLQGP